MSASKIVKEANRWVGYLEKKTNSNLDSFTGNAGYNNYTAFARDYCAYFNENLNIYQGQPWCAMFVSVIFANCFGTKKANELLVKHFAYCPTAVANFKSHGIWKTNNPKVGDVIFFRTKSKTEAAHTGIVIDVDKNFVYTIEGNTSSSSGVVDNGGCVAKKKYRLDYDLILGYGDIQYEEIDMEEIKKLEAEIINLKNIVRALSNPMIYNYIDENMPEWARPTIQKLVTKGYIKGDENGLGLTYDMLKILVILDRNNLFE